jgi:hypothetical protein
MKSENYRNGKFLQTPDNQSRPLFHKVKNVTEIVFDENRKF